MGTNEDLACEFVENMNVLDGRGSASNFFYEGATLYSYGTHFPLAIKIFDQPRVEFLMNAGDYSVSTRVHKGYFQSAASGYTVWAVPDCDIHRIHEYIHLDIWSNLQKIGPARGGLPRYMKNIVRDLEYYTLFCDRFKLSKQFTKLFRDADKRAITRMRKGCLYTGKSTYKLFREFYDIIQVRNTLLGE